MKLVNITKINRGETKEDRPFKWILEVRDS